MLTQTGAISLPCPSCVRQTEKVAPARRLPSPSCFSQIRPQRGRGSGAAKSFSSAVLRSSGLPWEVRVWAWKDVMQGVEPRTAVRSMPNSVNAFLGSSVILSPWLS